MNQAEDPRASSNEAPTTSQLRFGYTMMASDYGQIVTVPAASEPEQIGLGPPREYATVHAASRNPVADAENDSTTVEARNMPTVNSQTGVRSQDSSPSIVTHVRHSDTAAPSSDLQDCEELELSETLDELENLRRIVTEISTPDSQGRSDSGIVQHDAFLAQARLRPRYAPRQGAPKLQSEI